MDKNNSTIKFREIDYSKDISEINELFSIGLGSHHNKKTFVWKHIENPFGRSFGLLACDADKIVGVRMFMKWELTGEGKTIKAIRPVDTLTHPEYRGRGIFKELTLCGLEKYKTHYDLVFNTPNANSLPGNLKMGWSICTQKLDYKMALVTPYFGKTNFNLIKIDDFVQLEKNDVNNTVITTFPSESFIKWRYKDDLYEIAKIIVEERIIYIIYKTQNHRGIKFNLIEKIIGDSLYFKQALKILAAKTHIFFIYYLENKFTKFRFLLSSKRNEAVIVYNKDRYRVNDKICFTLGDLEASL
ncbi:Acetyltransferase (GNAT) domain-containing protein [Salegentibacter echinorum]|uniref:Acetyltransferase (GNAT) domain-containing protein n=1 Tax=Salegentibacter echinorum TaxID=1073325 RepID=A0A1M5FIH9_SALEC|nr:GNAT family N-acetyltransferase [Salegentibacter echinorum]SHF91350.1 Acetyltransferase (GNAT) domain-containing protein [Salegentibacter echinorum]